MLFSSVCVTQASIPSVPEFTVRYVDYSYDVEPTYEVDQFTGETVTTRAGYHVDKRTIEFTIKNQDFTPYQDADGNNIILYYNFRFKGPYGDEWTEYPYPDLMYGYLAPFPDIKASDSDYTVIKIPVNGLSDPTPGSRTVPTGVQVQFQVQAIIGYLDSSFVSLLAGSYIHYRGERSNWSDTQTIILSENSQTTESIPEFSSWVVLPLFVLIASVVFVCRTRLNKAKKTGVCP